MPIDLGQVDWLYVAVLAVFAFAANVVAKPISPARVRHAGPTGDTADYSSGDVEAMALRLGSESVRRP
jgi:hypothetical protein